MHYRCDEANGWDPDLGDIEARITPDTKGLVIINPNNPTGAVYTEATVRGMVDIARRHDLVVFSDEIYEKILFDDAVHHHTATYAGNDVLCLTFSGLSKAYRVCGYRAGLGDGLRPQAPRRGLPRGADPAGQHADVRQRAGPARHPDRARRLPVDRRVHRARAGASTSSARLAAGLLNEIPGVSCVEPRGRCTASRGWIPRSTRSRTTRRS